MTERMERDWIKVESYRDRTAESRGLTKKIEQNQGKCSKQLEVCILASNFPNHTKKIS